MDPRLKALLQLDYPVAMVYEEKAGGGSHYAAYLLDLPGCIAQGETEKEALDRLQSITPAYFEKLLQLRVDIPDPTPLPRIVPGTFSFYDKSTGAFRPVVASALEGSSQVHRDIKLQPV